MHAIILDGEPRELSPGQPFVDAEGVQHSADKINTITSGPRAGQPFATAAELAAIGVYAIEDAPIPEGKVATGSTLKLVKGKVRRTWTLADAPPPPVPASISDRQFAQALAMMGFVTQDEALAWASAGTLPPALDGAIDKLPEEHRFPARMLLSSATSYERAHPMVPTIGALMGMSDVVLDEAWKLGAAL